MRSLQLTLLAIGTLVLACSGEGIQTEPEDTPGTGGQFEGDGGSDGDPAAPDGGAAPGGTGGDVGGYPSTGGASTTGGAAGAGAITSTGGVETGGWTSTGGASTGGATWTGGYGGDIGGSPFTGGTAGTGTGGAAEFVNYFDPAPPQPTEFSCCVIWAHCVHHQQDYRCTEATLLVTNSNRDDACDIWLQQVQDPIGSESIPYCL